jgi:hypothetical protein
MVAGAARLGSAGLHHQGAYAPGSPSERSLRSLTLPARQPRFGYPFAGRRGTPSVAARAARRLRHVRAVHGRDCGSRVQRGDDRGPPPARRGGATPARGDGQSLRRDGARRRLRHQLARPPPERPRGEDVGPARRPRPLCPLRPVARPGRHARHVRPPVGVRRVPRTPPGRIGREPAAQLARTGRHGGPRAGTRPRVGDHRDGRRSADHGRPRGDGRGALPAGAPARLLVRVPRVALLRPRSVDRRRDGCRPARLAGTARGHGADDARCGAGAARARGG